jgi:hypothetical protein
MQSTAKAIALARDLADKLAKRYAPGAAGLNSVRQAFDAQGWPMIFCSHNGNEAEAQPVLAIRIRNVDAVSKDIFGNQTFAYAPHIIETAYELASANCPEPSLADVAIAEFESIKTGCRWQLKEIANGTAVSEASMNAASANQDLEELYWPTKSV